MECSPKCGPAAVEVGLDGGDGEAEKVGHFGVRVALDVSEDDDDAVVVGKRGERSADVVDAGEVFGVVLQGVGGEREVVGG